MLNNKRYNVDRFGDLDKIYFGDTERAYVIEPAGIEKNKYDLFTDFLASFMYKHGYKDTLKGLSQESKDWSFKKDFEKLMNVFSAVDEAREKNKLKSLGVNTYVNHLKMNGLEIKVSDEIKDELQAGMYKKTKDRELRLESTFTEEKNKNTKTVKF